MLLRQALIVSKTLFYKKHPEAINVASGCAFYYLEERLFRPHLNHLPCGSFHIILEIFLKLSSLDSCFF